MPISQFNNWNAPLAAFGFPGDVFNGAPEPTGTAAAISVNILCGTLTTLTIQQSYNTSNFYYQQQYQIQGGQLTTIQMPVVLPYFRVNILNQTQATQQYCNMNTSLVPQLTQNVDIRPLTGATDSVSITGAVDISGGVIDISGGTVEVTNFPAQQLVTGENSNFVFYPTAANNTVSIYADGTKGTDVAGGWQYANLNTVGKINWYCYSSLTPATDYKVSQLNSMYTVINQQSTLGLATAQNPWIMVYTRMDSGVNSGGFYKSKLFFGSNAHTDILGLKLLYTGEDPTHIHPEITGINRIQLLFISALSDNKQLADVQNESILAGSLQTTNNTSPANSFAFVMTEFGADWVKTPAVLPIEFGKVQVDITGQAVVVSGTVATDISGQHVVVSSAPHLSKTTDSVDISGQTVIVGGSLPTGSNTVGKVITFESPSSTISLTGLGNTGQTIKASPGSLFNITVFNDGNAISYVKLYDVAVPTASDTPIITLPVLHDVAINTISIHNVQFSTAIGVRATASYTAGDIADPNGTTSITAFFNGLLP
jgi:hypothetical protein